MAGKLRFGAFIAPFHPLDENPTLALERDLDRTDAAADALHRLEPAHGDIEQAITDANGPVDPMQAAGGFGVEELFQGVDGVGWRRAGKLHGLGPRGGGEIEDRGVAPGLVESDFERGGRKRAALGKIERHRMNLTKTACPERL